MASLALQHRWSDNHRDMLTIRSSALSLQLEVVDDDGDTAESVVVSILLLLLLAGSPSSAARASAICARKSPWDSTFVTRYGVVVEMLLARWSIEDDEVVVVAVAGGITAAASTSVAAADTTTSPLSLGGSDEAAVEDTRTGSGDLRE